jgi:acetolactate synthase-1/2/3 large subunit
MKLSDYIAFFLHSGGITHVFGVTGGASAHLIDSIAEHGELHFVCSMHEQAAAMAADGYSRARGDIGCALATSGPGATNLITGICSAYYDSVPVLFLTGQVATFRMKGTSGVRQLGFQETDILPMCEPVTKYVVQITDPQMIRYELEKAWFYAKDGRPGPVLIDIPDNIQREEIEPDVLQSFEHPVVDKKPYTACVFDKCAELLQKAKRPVIVFGWGIHAAKANAEALELLEKSGIPFVPTWAAADIFSSDHLQYIGTFGTHGTRFGNFAVQNADLILSVGSRLDTKATGSPASTFARAAVKIMVDIDPTELEKFSALDLVIDHPICCDAKVFLQNLNSRIGKLHKPDRSPWLEQITTWKKKYPICQDHYCLDQSINPYVFFDALAQQLPVGQMLVSDTGNTLAWLMQSFSFKKGQRLLHDWNTTAMGWALPASIGVCMANIGQDVICITGDGSLQMNLQELASVIRYKLPIKIILINNKGYGMIQQTQDQWFEGRYHASSIAGGLAFPDFVELARVYGFPVKTITSNDKIQEGIETMIATAGFYFCNIDVELDQRIEPLVKFGRPNEDMEPLLKRKEFFNNMIVAPI